MRIYSRLRRGPITIDIIKAWARKNDIQVSERTLYRDLKEIEQSIMPEGERIVVIEGEKNKKTWKIEYHNSADKLNDFDINSFLLFKNFAPLVLVSARSKSLYKIENMFYTYYSKSRFEHLATVADFQIAGTDFYEFSHAEDYQQVLEDCVWSVQHKREMLIKSILYDHTSIAANVTFPIYLLPLQILYHRGCIHVAGLIKNTHKPIVIALEQFDDYELTNHMFDNTQLLPLLVQEMNKRFGITENMNDKVYDIAIEFSQFTGSFVANHFWHPSQQFTQRKNGNILMTMTCGINRELVGWIFQWMSNAKVLRPRCLQALVKDRLEAVSKLYTHQQVLQSNNIFRAQ